MVATLCAQFLSALADNALIFAALAVVRQHAYPTWSGPLLQEFFVGTYILLAPFVGVFADTQSKGRVMMLANLAKFAGALAMCLKCNPFLSYAIVGAGAAAYSPAKYGILGELTSADHLVKANGLIEVSTIAAILIGSIAGGALTDWSVLGAIAAITACYALASLSTMLIPRLAPAVKSARFSIFRSVSTFSVQTRQLLRSADARLAVIGTGLFWGAGAALRFLVIAWVPQALHISNNRIAGYLTGMVAVGIVVGAGLAARFVRITQVNRALPAGIFLGLGVCLLPLAHSLPPAFAVMTVVGVCSGFFLVPLDALLQKRGEESVGVGVSIAIQNLFENLIMLFMMGTYTFVTYKEVPINTVALCFGGLLALTMSALTAARLRSPENVKNS